MKCPTDGSDLVMSERQGIEIDYCPKCRGIWLDRGELDKIIERSAAVESPQPTLSQARSETPSYQSRDDDDDHYDRRDPRSRKRKGFLGELFDFD